MAHFDETKGRDGTVRSCYRLVDDWLAKTPPALLEARRAQAEMMFRRIGITLHPESSRPTLNPATLETNVPGVYMAGSISAGRAISDVFIENGRFHGDVVVKVIAERLSARRHC